MRIAYITSESYLDHSYTIVNSLSKKTDLTVFMQAKERTIEIDSWCKKFDAEFVKRKRFRNPLSFFSELVFLLKIKKINAGAVWFNTLTAYQALIAKLLFKNILVMMHDVDIHPETNDYYSVLSLKLTLALFKKSICTASHTQASIFEKRYGIKPKIFQLPVIDYYTESGIESKQTQSENMPVKFFFFGSIEAYKGIEILLEAAEILENKNIILEINIYGKLKYNTEQLKNRIKKLKSVNLTDSFIPYTEIQKIYRENSVQILPYRQVTQCGPLLIGYNELVPSICSKLDGFDEYVDDGKSGFLFNTPEDLADKMEMIAKNPGLMTGIQEYIKRETFNKFSMESLSEAYITNLKNV